MRADRLSDPGPTPDGPTLATAATAPATKTTVVHQTHRGTQWRTARNLVMIDSSPTEE